MIYDEPRYVMSQLHPEYFRADLRDWCVIESTLYSPDKSVHMVEVHWYGKHGDAIGYEAIPLDWLALKEAKQVSAPYISLW